MYIPQYWIKAEASDVSPKGETVRGECWGWSDRSEQEARSLAERRARDFVRRLATGAERSSWYDYDDRPIREERVREEPFGIITRSSYGSLILNCPDTMFIDVDSEPAQRGVAGLLKRLFGQRSEPQSYPEVETLKAFHERNREWSFRVYKTHSGFRYIATNGRQDPTSETVRRVMDAVGADPLYMKLCASQKCFRARVSPKPWRCGSRSPNGRFPFSHESQRNRFAEWKAEYDRLENGYATAHFLEALGTAGDRSLQAAITLHDTLCRVQSALPLA